MKVPDLTKPRITEKKGKVLEYKEVVAFNKKFPEYNGLSQKQMLDVIRGFHKNIIEETMINPHGVTFPENFGTISIVNAGKSKHKQIDYAKSKQYGKTVYHKNWDTDNNMMAIVYSRNVKNIIKNSGVFRFESLQEYRRKASLYWKNWQKCVTKKRAECQQ